MRLRRLLDGARALGGADDAARVFPHQKKERKKKKKIGLE
jgi:hypothetical protein